MSGFGSALKKVATMFPFRKSPTAAQQDLKNRHRAQRLRQTHGQGNIDSRHIQRF